MPHRVDTTRSFLASSRSKISRRRTSRPRRYADQRRGQPTEGQSHKQEDGVDSFRERTLSGTSSENGCCLTGLINGPRICLPSHGQLPPWPACAASPPPPASFRGGRQVLQRRASPASSPVRARMPGRPRPYTGERRARGGYGKHQKLVCDGIYIPSYYTEIGKGGFWRTIQSSTAYVVAPVWLLPPTFRPVAGYLPFRRRRLMFAPKLLICAAMLGFGCWLCRAIWCRLPI
jgi:hypothetical protein